PHRELQPVGRAGENVRPKIQLDLEDPVGDVDMTGGDGRADLRAGAGEGKEFEGEIILARGGPAPVLQPALVVERGAERGRVEPIGEVEKRKSQEKPDEVFHKVTKGSGAWRLIARARPANKLKIGESSGRPIRTLPLRRLVLFIRTLIIFPSCRPGL